jgi:hypothetical protein
MIFAAALAFSVLLISADTAAYPVQDKAASSDLSFTYSLKLCLLTCLEVALLAAVQSTATATHPQDAESMRQLGKRTNS